jgi:phosphoserine/homoserine phosphotransferase
MEGVLTPEIWIAVAILDQHGIKLSDIQNVIGSLNPLPGAKEFLDQLRALVQVIILSDTFEQFAAPLLRQLNYPTLLCHRLIVENDRVVDYQLRLREQKREAVAAFRRLNYHVISAGDSYNDTAMLKEANAGFLIHAPDNVKKEFPQFPAVESHAELLKLIQGAL